MTRSHWMAALLAAAITGCTRGPRPLAPGTFRVSATGFDADGAGQYRAFDDERCAFSITIARDKDGEQSGPFAFGTAVLRRESQADCRPFLLRLAPSLGFKGTLPEVPPLDELPIGITIVATQQSRESGSFDVPSSFIDHPAGPWLLTKLFLADGKGEVYLNIDVADSRGELATKDEEYADVVVRELAKIMMPR